MSLHKNITPDDQHLVYFRTYANAAARTLAVQNPALVVLDIGKVAWQQDDDTFFFLKNNVGPVWAPFTGNIDAVSSVNLDDQALHAVDGLSEQVAAEFSIDFTLLPAANLKVVLAALTQQTGGATGTYRIRIGGTVGVADGTVVATLATTNASFPNTPDGVTGSSFANPAGRSLVKVTAVSSLGGERARIRGTQISFEAV